MPSRNPRRLDATGPLHQEIDHGVEIGLCFRTDTIAANFAALYTLEVKFFNEFVHRQFIFEIRLVSQHKKRDSSKGSVAHEIMQLISSLRDQGYVGNIDDENNGADATTISLPHGSKSRLASNVPTLECNMAPLYALHIEPDRRNRATRYLESADASVPQSRS